MKKLTVVLGAAVIAGSLLIGGMALAAGPGQGISSHIGSGWMMARGGLGVFGSVTAVSGTTLTVTSKGFGFGRNATTTTSALTVYTVDAANATVTKNGASSTIASVSVGDNVMVRGTVSGTTVSATQILDGMPSSGTMPWKGGSRGSSSTPAFTSAIQGNGEPVVGGTIASVSGTTLTVTNKSNVTYTVDASNATVLKGRATSSLASVNVNDNVLIQGRVNGTAVTASSIIDQGASQSGSSTVGASPGQNGFMGKMFGGIGSFFHRIFGFF